MLHFSLKYEIILEIETQKQFVTNNNKKNRVISSTALFSLASLAACSWAGAAPEAGSAAQSCPGRRAVAARRRFPPGRVAEWTFGTGRQCRIFASIEIWSPVLEITTVSCFIFEKNYRFFRQKFKGFQAKPILWRIFLGVCHSRSTNNREHLSSRTIPSVCSREAVAI